MVRHCIQAPALPMVRPYVLVAGHPLSPTRGGEGHRPGRRLLRRERYGGTLEAEVGQAGSCTGGKPFLVIRGCQVRYHEP
jgi:hypothetical protein